jgi:hypothetical protein
MRPGADLLSRFWLNRACGEPTEKIGKSAFTLAGQILKETAVDAMRMRNYSYIIDGVSGPRLVQFYRAIAQAGQLTKVRFDKETRVLNVEAAWDPEPSIRLACQVVGASYRGNDGKSWAVDGLSPGG